MSRALNYLKGTLSPEQYEEYRRQAMLDGRDSTARGKMRYIRQWGNKGTKVQGVATAKAWLRRYGYINEAGEWIADVPCLYGRTHAHELPADNR